MITMLLLYLTVAKNSSLAMEALAGLASTEDFSNITLRNVAETNISTNKLQPFKDLMLLLIKGRRHVQVRSVEPVAESINSGDNFVLVTKSEVIKEIVSNRMFFERYTVFYHSKLGLQLHWKIFQCD